MRVLVRSTMGGAGSLATCGALAVLACAGLVPPAPPDATPSVATDVWYAWSALDQRNGRQFGSANAETQTTSTESMIKLWLGTDYLLGIQNREPTSDERALLHDMIHDSDDDAAEVLWASGGGDPVIERLISEAGLRNTTVYPGWWSMTQMSAADAVRMLDYIEKLATHNSAAQLIIDEARAVAPETAFGIAPLLGDTPVVVKNGWTDYGGEWHVNCLAGWDLAILAIMTRYPSELGIEYGAALCSSIAQAVLPSLNRPAH